MSKFLVLYYSMYDHTRALAKGIVRGAASIPGTQVDRYQGAHVATLAQRPVDASATRGAA